MSAKNDRVCEKRFAIVWSIGNSVGLFITLDFILWHHFWDLMVINSFCWLATFSRNGTKRNCCQINSHWKLQTSKWDNDFADLVAPIVFISFKDETLNQSCLDTWWGCFKLTKHAPPPTIPSNQSTNTGSARFWTYSQRALRKSNSNGPFLSLSSWWHILSRSVCLQVSVPTFMYLVTSSFLFWIWCTFSSC